MARKISVCAFIVMMSPCHKVGVYVRRAVTGEGQMSDRHSNNNNKIASLHACHIIYNVLTLRHLTNIILYKALVPKYNNTHTHTFTHIYTHTHYNYNHLLLFLFEFLTFSRPSETRFFIQSFVRQLSSFCLH